MHQALPSGYGICLLELNLCLLVTHGLPHCSYLVLKLRRLEAGNGAVEVTKPHHQVMVEYSIAGAHAGAFDFEVSKSLPIRAVAARGPKAKVLQSVRDFPSFPFKMRRHEAQ